MLLYPMKNPPATGDFLYRVSLNDSYTGAQDTVCSEIHPFGKSITFVLFKILGVAAPDAGQPFRQSQQTTSSVLHNFF